MSVWDSRRSSSDSARLSTIKAITSTNNARAPIKIRAPQEIADILENSLEWEFEIFQLEVLTDRRWVSNIFNLNQLSV